MTLGTAIKILRTARGMKQSELARAMNISSNYLSLVERGKREPSISFLNRLAEKLTIPLSVLFMTQELETSTPTPQLQELGRLIVQLQAAVASDAKSGKKRRGKKKKAA